MDASPELDLEPIYHSEGAATGEIEAMGIQSLLESHGIAAVMVGDSVLPNMPFEVRVAHEHVQEALRLMADAQKTGPMEAEIAERATESGGSSESSVNGIPE